MSLRLIPYLNVCRPADVIETAECWNIALQDEDTPSVLALTRQNLPQLRHEGEMLSARGAYTLRRAEATRKVILIATGSEVELAVNVAKALEARGGNHVGADALGLELFDAQDEAYKHEVLPRADDLLKVSIEAGVSWGWERYTGTNGLNFGLDRFGASAPAEDLFHRFGFSVEAIVPKIKDKLAS